MASWAKAAGLAYRVLPLFRSLLHSKAPSCPYPQARRAGRTAPLSFKKASERPLDPPRRHLLGRHPLRVSLEIVRQHLVLHT